MKNKFITYSLTFFLTLSVAFLTANALDVSLVNQATTNFLVRICNFVVIGSLWSLLLVSVLMLIGINVMKRDNPKEFRDMCVKSYEETKQKVFWKYFHRVRMALTLICLIGISYTVSAVVLAVSTALMFHIINVWKDESEKAPKDDFADFTSEVEGVLRRAGETLKNAEQ